MEKVNVYSIDDVSNYFLAKTEMTPKKLQKILYFAYSWYLAFMNESKDKLNIRLFDSRFEAWIHGPVCPKIYSKYKLRMNLIEKFNGNVVEFIGGSREILEAIWEVYGKYTDKELESITKQHSPWIKTRERAKCSDFGWCCEVIPDEFIFEYYFSKIKDKFS